MADANPTAVAVLAVAYAKVGGAAAGRIDAGRIRCTGAHAAVWPTRISERDADGTASSGVGHAMAAAAAIVVERARASELLATILAGTLTTVRFRDRVQAARRPAQKEGC